MSSNNPSQMASSEILSRYLPGADLLRFNKASQSYVGVGLHDDVIKWKHFPRYWPFVRGIHRPPVNFPHKGQWRGALMFSLICVWRNDWVNSREADNLRRQRDNYFCHCNAKSYLLLPWHRDHMGPGEGNIYLPDNGSIWQIAFVPSGCHVHNESLLMTNTDMLQLFQLVVSRTKWLSYDNINQYRQRSKHTIGTSIRD